jgi:hypothetical protein
MLFGAVTPALRVVPDSLSRGSAMTTVSMTSPTSSMADQRRLLAVGSVRLWGTRCPAAPPAYRSRIVLAAVLASSTLALSPERVTSRDHR